MASTLAKPTSREHGATTSDWTPEAVNALREGKSYELVDGNLVERSMSILADGAIGMVTYALVGFLLDNPVAEYVGSETTFACFPDDPTETRRADVALVLVDRLIPEALTGVVRIAPDLVIEVLSPGDVAYDVNTKVDRWRAAGTRLVWVIDPMTRRVFVFSANAERILGAADELDGEDVLPGFACPVANLFRTSRDRAAAK
ncbi:MAG: Uma2 family endonuclease [Planctomycetota bacterium]